MRFCDRFQYRRVVIAHRWRSADALRNALSAHAYWALRKHDDFSATQATRRLEGATVSDKNEILFERGINFNDVPTWQKPLSGVAQPFE